MNNKLESTQLQTLVYTYIENKISSLLFDNIKNEENLKGLSCIVKAQNYNRINLSFVNKDRLLIELSSNKIVYEVNSFSFNDDQKQNYLFLNLLNYIQKNNELEINLRETYNGILKIIDNYFKTSKNIISKYFSLLNECISSENKFYVREHYLQEYPNINNFLLFLDPIFVVNKYVKGYSYTTNRVGKDNLDTTVTITFYKLLYNDLEVDNNLKEEYLQRKILFEKILEKKEVKEESSHSYFGLSYEGSNNQYTVNIGVDFNITRQIVQNENEFSYLCKEDFNLIIYFIFFDHYQLFCFIKNKYEEDIYAIFFDLIYRYIDFIYSEINIMERSLDWTGLFKKRRQRNIFNSHFKQNGLLKNNMYKLKSIFDFILENISKKIDINFYNKSIENFLINHPTDIHSAEIYYLLYNKFKKYFED